MVGLLHLQSTALLPPLLRRHSIASGQGSCHRRACCVEAKIREIFMPVLSSIMTEGKIVSWTTAEETAQVVNALKTRNIISDVSLTPHEKPLSRKWLPLGSGGRPKTRRSHAPPAASATRAAQNLNATRAEPRLARSRLLPLPPPIFCFRRGGAEGSLLGIKAPISNPIPSSLSPAVSPPRPGGANREKVAVSRRGHQICVLHRWW
ncbi:hypothetical protein GUJ93_ZPchr0006g43899 [Zizania palustris]|uniref:Uncharacterized protein n=1 Tax=Zizania palustris TaxID=103762 RepID=A0A8J5SCN2_ZIZPA|nr:hypothetical protein GUJ93_ZPchr0006g43899 [Zizania palustris]